LYGEKSELVSRQALHSYEIRCIHPITNENLIFSASLPEDLQI